MKKIDSNLKRFIKFGDIEIKPFENIIEDDQHKELEKNKIFNHYIKTGDFKIVEEEETADYSDFVELSMEELKEKYTVEDLDAICKDLKFRGYKELLEEEKIEKIIAKVK